MNHCVNPFKNNTHLHITLDRVQQQLPHIRHDLKDSHKEWKNTERILPTNQEKLYAKQVQAI